MTKKILAITTIRSDYNLNYELYKLLHNDPEIDLQILVSGAHMSGTYGYSVQEIEKHGFNILCKLETLIDADSKASRLKTASLMLQNSIDIVSHYNPDLIIYSGDREDVMVGGLLSAYLEIPSIHFFGGDHVKDGHVDNPVRHATSKLSTAHFVSTQQHYDRLLALGEHKERIFNTGSIALDKFVNVKVADKASLLEKFNLPESFSDFAVCIFHPIPEERDIADKIAANILDSLIEEDIPCFISYPNTDPANRKIIETYDRYKDHKNFYFYRNLPGDDFLSVYKNSRFMIGNSSSGVLEAASIPIPTINVGIRQQGRYAEQNVLWTETDKDSILASIRKAQDSDYLNTIKDMKNPYGDGDSSPKAYELIKKLDLKKMVLKKDDPLELLNQEPQ